MENGGMEIVNVDFVGRGIEAEFRISRILRLMGESVRRQIRVEWHRQVFARWGRRDKRHAAPRWLVRVSRSVII